MFVWVPAADRGLRRRAPAGPRARDRDLPLRLDPRGRPDALGRRPPGAGALGVVGVSAAFGALVTWYNQPLVASGIEQRLHASTFPVTGVAVAGWGAGGVRPGRARPACSCGGCVPALAAALAVWTGLAFLAASCCGPLPRAPGHDQPAAGGPVTSPSTSGGPTRRTCRTRAQINQALQAIGVQSDQRWRDFRRRRAGGRRPRRPRPVPAPSRLQPGHQLPARQSLLALPVDRVRVAHRAVGAAHRGHPLAGTPPCCLSPDWPAAGTFRTRRRSSGSRRAGLAGRPRAWRRSASADRWRTTAHTPR